MPSFGSLGGPPGSYRKPPPTAPGIPSAHCVFVWLSHQTWLGPGLTPLSYEQSRSSLGSTHRSPFLSSSEQATPKQPQPKLPALAPHCLHSYSLCSMLLNCPHMSRLSLHLKCPCAPPHPKPSPSSPWERDSGPGNHEHCEERYVEKWVKESS